jgi:hypothetical protein
MNTTDTQNQCISTKDGITITSAIVGILLLISEIMPFFRPKDNYNGLIQSIQNILQEHLKKSNQVLQNHD